MSLATAANVLVGAQRLKRGHSRRSQSIAVIAPAHTSTLKIEGLTKLGEGTSGQAFLIANDLDGCKYAIKTVPLPVRGTPEADQVWAEVTNEARLHASLHHENIVKYSYSFHDHTERTFNLLMELCGGDLWTRVESAMDGGAAIPAADRERWSRQLAGAVAHMHERGIVHRDLNPWNVFVVNEGGKENVKIGDFGLSVRCAVGETLSGEATAGAAPLDPSAIGSLYSAPELGSDSYGHSADVFSLGVTTFVIWAADPSKRTLDDVITAVEALHDTGKLDGSGKTGGFASECPLAPLLERCASHDAPSRPTAAECAAAWQQSAAKAPSKVLLLVRHGESTHNISSVAEHSDRGHDAALFDAPLSDKGREQVAQLAGHSELAVAEVILVSPLTRALQTLDAAFPTRPPAAAEVGIETGVLPAHERVEEYVKRHSLRETLEAAVNRALEQASDDPLASIAEYARSRSRAAVEAERPPVEVEAMLAEHLTDSCDIGSGRAALQAHWPALDFGKLPEVWWYTDGEASTTDAADSRRHYREAGFMEPLRAVEARVDRLAAALRARPERTLALFGHADLFHLLMERHCGRDDKWLKNAEVLRVELQ